MVDLLEGAPERLVERLVELLEQPVEDLESIRRTVLSGWRPGLGLAGLERACEGVGLQADRVECEVDEVARLLAPETLVVGQSRQGGWLILRAARGDRLWADVPGAVAAAQPVSAAEVAAQLGASPSSLWPWLVVSGRPLAALEACAPPAEHAPPGPSPWARLFGLFQTERQDIAVVLVFAAAVGLLLLATPVVMQVVVNTVSFGVVLQPLVLLSVILLGCLGLAAALRALQVWVVEVIQRRIFLRLAADLAWRLPRVEQRAFDKAYGPELVNRFFDVFTVKKVAASLLLDGVEILLTAVIGAMVLAFYHPALLAFDLILIVSVTFIVFLMGRNATKTSIKESKAKYEVAGWLQELARHQHAFRHTGGKRLAMERADALTRTYLGYRSKHFAIVYRQGIGLLALQALAMTALVAVGGWLVIERQLTLGQLVAAELIVSAVVASLSKLSKYLESVYDMLAAMDKLGQLVDLPLERRGGEVLEGRGAASLLLEGVAFSHNSERPVLQEVNLSLAPGERVMVMGADGAGLSTLADVIYGLRQPDRGWVEVGGVELRSADLSALRLRVAVVRTAEVIDGTIFENVQLGRREVGAAEVRRALAMVELLEEIQAMPGGLQRSLSGGGGVLSTSQSVRLTLARAIAGHPQLLVLDDALEQLSEEVAERLLARLAAPEAPWTLLVLGRAAWMAPHCDRVLRLEKGRLFNVEEEDGGGWDGGGWDGGGSWGSPAGGVGRAARGAADPAAAEGAPGRGDAGGGLRADRRSSGAGPLAAERDRQGARDRLRADGAPAGVGGAGQGGGGPVVGAGGEPGGRRGSAAGAAGQRSAADGASGDRAGADGGSGGDLRSPGGGAEGARGGGASGAPVQGGLGGGEGADVGARAGGVASEGAVHRGEAGDEPPPAGPGADPV